MNPRILFLIALALFVFGAGTTGFAQVNKAKADSMRLAREHAADSMRRAREHTADSIKTARQQRMDSLQQARKRRTDSIQAVAKYKNSKKYKDSVARARNAKLNVVKDARQARLDSLADARKRTTDSMALARKTRTDSLKVTQKRRTDSMTAVKKYKSSKRYADSVTIAKNRRTDSIKAEQAAYRDSVATVRKKGLDATKAARKHVTDSIKTARTKTLDSIKLVRKGKTDSLAKKKTEKEKLAKAKEKKKEDLTKLKLELKIKQKREAWSNKTMLKKKWTPVRALTQNAFTHYNYYFNANRKMEEAETNMRRAGRDNYDSLIGLFPFDPNKDSTLMAADMDSIIHKVSVGIQIHDPRVKWSNDMYLLLGQAYYYKGNYENASIAFRYIIASDAEAKKAEAAKKGGSARKGPASIVQEDEKGLKGLLKHKSVHNDAILWLSRTYTSAGQIENAETILSLLESDKLPTDMKGRLALEKGFTYLATGNRPAAAAQLTIAANDNNIPGWQRQRAAFLAGQLLQDMNSYTEAAFAFEEVLDHYPKVEMEFYARKYIAYNRLMAGQKPEEAMIALKKILNDGKYAAYHDQVYFTLGRLAMKADRNNEAITYFAKSTAVPKASKKQKAVSFAALGDAYYSVARYTNAKAAYDSAAKYSSGTKDATVTAALQKSKVLSEIAGPIKQIRDQDSLLQLASLSKRDQQAAVRSFLKQREKARQDSILNAATAEAKAPEVETPADGGSGAGWYFSNPTQLAQGSSDFKRKWGNRPLADNWRRASAVALATTTGGGSIAETEEDEQETIAASSKNDISEEALLARIPNTPQQKEATIAAQQKAYIQLAKAYVKHLDDYPRALHALDTLNMRYPSHGQKEEELYLRYQIAMKQNQLDKGLAYSKELLAKFPNSQYAALLRPSESGVASQASNKQVIEYYDETYKLLLQHQYTEVLMRTGYAKKQYSDPRYRKRFQIIEASAHAGMGSYNEADSVIGTFIRSNAGDSLIGWATTVQDYIKQVRNGGKPSWYKEGPLQNITAAKDKPAAGDPAAAPAPAKPAAPVRPPNVPYSYSFQADSEHYMIIVLPGIDSRTGDFKRSLQSFNRVRYANANLEVLLDLFDIPEAAFVVRKFANAAAAKAYMADVSEEISKVYMMGEVKPMIISAPNYRKMLYEKETQPYGAFYGSYYQ